MARAIGSTTSLRPVRRIWTVGECGAIPHYLLTKITDRHGFAQIITWGGTLQQPRVTKVKYGSTGPEINLGYDGDLLLTSVADSQGRTHSMLYDPPVPDENGQPQKKLQQATVRGPGSPRTTYNWQFVYRDPDNPNEAYSGTYSGDLSRSSAGRPRCGRPATIGTGG